MKIHCFRCRQKTETEDLDSALIYNVSPDGDKSSKPRAQMRGKCVVCGAKKAVFVKLSDLKNVENGESLNGDGLYMFGQKHSSQAGEGQAGEGQAGDGLYMFGQTGNGMYMFGQTGPFPLHIVKRPKSTKPRKKRSTASATKTKDETVSDVAGDGIIDNVIDLGKDVVRSAIRGDNPISGLLPRQYSPKVRETLEKYGDLDIEEMYIFRTPLTDAIMNAVNIISAGDFKKRAEALGYDSVFHLFMVVRLADGQFYLIEKNQVIEIKKRDGYPSGPTTERIRVNDIDKFVPGVLNMRSLLENGRRHQGDANFFRYNAFFANCQVFMRVLLEGSRLITPELKKFIMQKGGDLLAPKLRPVVQGVTDLAGVLNRLIHGS